MKILKYLFFILLIGIIGFTIYVATLDGDFHVKENLTIEAPREMLFDEVNNYETWKEWALMAEENPNLIVDYSDKRKGEGAEYTWKTDDIQGKITTTKVIPGKTIEQKAVIKTSAGEAVRQIYWNFENTEEGTKITWEIKGEQSFMEKAYSLTRDNTISERLQTMMKTGLGHLSQNLKAAMDEFSVNVDGLTQHSGGFYMYMTTASRNSPKVLNEKIERIIAQVHHYMEENHITLSGPPMTVYNQIDEQNGTVIISSGISTSNRIIPSPESEVLCGFLPSQNVLKTTLRGNYKYLPKAWEAARRYLTQNGFEIPENAEPFEVYARNPGDSQNPAEWVTELYIPIQESEKLNP